MVLGQEFWSSESRAGDKGPFVMITGRIDVMRALLARKARWGEAVSGKEMECTYIVVYSA